jgi:hypothetical protein
MNGLLEREELVDKWFVLVSDAWKLQDPGVNLTYVKTRQVQIFCNSRCCCNSENKYWLYVDKEDHLIKQWAYYKTLMTQTKFLKPWNNYQKRVTSYFLLTDQWRCRSKNVIVKTNIDSSIYCDIKSSI